MFSAWAVFFGTGWFAGRNYGWPDVSYGADGRAVNRVPVDVALMGAVVPSGDHELVV